MHRDWIIGYYPNHVYLRDQSSEPSVTRLRMVAPDTPGWRRRRQGRGFAYLNGDTLLAPLDRKRCRKLVIPPAWTDVWICPYENGHLQAVGTDESGRRQYLYHPDWRVEQDRGKFDFMLKFAGQLPNGRRRVRRDLKRETLDLSRACALAFRMLDVGAFRIGSERYTDENGSYGLLTLERRHVRKTARGLQIKYPAKSGQERSLIVSDPSLDDAMDVLRARRGPRDQRLLAYKSNSRWHDLRAEQLSSYLKERLGQEASAKDFRTWQANVIAAAALATSPAASATGHKGAVAEAMREVAEFLGNTPAVARSGYVDPRLIDLYDVGETVDPDLARQHMPTAGSALSPSLERAVLALLEGRSVCRTTRTAKP